MFVDDYFGTYFNYYMVYKKALSGLIAFKQKYENLISLKIKRIRIDNGREFINKEFSEYLETMELHTKNLYRLIQRVTAK